MEIILIEKITKLGKLGDLVKVKSGYARNFLFPQRKAILATKKNIEYIQSKINEININLQQSINKAKEKAEKINKINNKIIIFAKVGKNGKLFGSINKNNIIESLNHKHNILIEKNEINFPNGFLRVIGKHLICLKFHKEISINLTVEIKSI